MTPASPINLSFQRPLAMTPRPTKQSGLASLACTECRKQHLKCDARKPSCSRCLQNDYPCQYLPSRRGGRRKPQQDANRRRTTSSQPDRLNVSPQGRPRLMKQPLTETQSSLVMPVPATSPQRSVATGFPAAQVAWPMIPPRSELNTERLEPTRDPWFHDDRFLRLFYEYFHVAHPILVPSDAYHDRHYPEFLQLVVNFVGSHYVPSSSSQQFKDKVLAELTCTPDRSPCMVQAWLIYSIAIYARGASEEAQNAFARSVELALELGMNRRDFAASVQPETSLEAESMRRTWWELYITDVFMAAPFKGHTFQCSTMAPEVALPCEESEYTGACEIPKPRQILDFKRRVFAAEETVFSSFSYRIEATTILCRALVLNRLRDYHRDHLQAVENALVSWVNHLPPKKLDIVDSYGNIDEMMFQAHMTIAYATMLLHLPRSDLQPVLGQAEDDQFWPVATRHHSSTLNRPIHSIKATEASRRISDAISLCPNVPKHTPFAIPALALCGMIQLATAIKHTEECFDHHYNRVTLILGCLKSTKRIWGLADAAFNRLRTSAAEALSDPMERWCTEPLRKLFPAESTPSSTERTTQPSRPASAMPEAQDILFPPIAPAFVDPTCYNDSFFTSVPDFDIN